MELKTKIKAEENTQELFITREFDLPLELLFKAYEDAEIVEQWMNTKVIKLENHKHGSWRFETSHDGQVVFSANGVILEFIPNEKITRTFEMENSPFPVAPPRAWSAPCEHRSGPPANVPMDRKPA